MLGGTSRFNSIFLIFANAEICNDSNCISATRPAHVAPTFAVIGNVFFVVLLTRKFPYAIRRSLAKTTPLSNVIPTAVAPGIYIDMKYLSNKTIKVITKIYAQTSL